MGVEVGSGSESREKDGRWSWFNSLSLRTAMNYPEYIPSSSASRMPASLNIRRILAITSNLTNYHQCPVTCLYILILVLISSIVKPADIELHYYLLISSQSNLKGFAISLEKRWGLKKYNDPDCGDQHCPEAAGEWMGSWGSGAGLLRYQFKTTRAQD